MSKTRNRRRDTIAPTPFEQARDEMFQHIIGCGVMQATPEHQQEWFTETMAYLEERYHELSKGELEDLRALGVRFCEPPKAKANSETANASAA